MRSNRVIVLTAMACYVCEGKVEFHNVGDVLKVSLSRNSINCVYMCCVQAEAEADVLILIFLEKLVCCES